MAGPKSGHATTISDAQRETTDHLRAEPSLPDDLANGDSPSPGHIASSFLETRELSTVLQGPQCDFPRHGLYTLLPFNCPNVRMHAVSVHMRDECSVRLSCSRILLSTSLLTFPAFVLEGLVAACGSIFCSRLLARPAHLLSIFLLARF